MLSYKEYKLLNESLYGAFNLGLKSHTTVGGIVSSSPINGTEAAEEAIEEAKKAKKMKKKMDGEMDAEDHDDEEEVIDKVKSSDDDEDHDDDEDDEDDEDEDHDDDEDEDSKDDEDDEDEVKSKTDLNKKDFSFMKNKMKKKSKKEWSDVMSDLESIIEVVDDEEALTEVKKGLEMMKRGMEKGMKKYMGCGTKKCGKYMSEGENSHKCDCDCPVCNNKKDHDGEEEGKGLTAGQKKLPKALQDAILAKKGKKKAEGKEEKKEGGGHGGKEEAAKDAEFGLIMVNLSGSGSSRYLRTNFFIKSNDAKIAEIIKENQPALRDAAITVLSAQTPAGLENNGRDIVRKALISQFNRVLGGEVVDQIYFSEFVIQ